MNGKFTEISDAVFSSSTDSLVQIVSFWPNILAAAAVLLFGWLISWLLKKLIVKLGEKLRFGHFAGKIGFDTLLEKANISASPSEVIANFFQAWIITVFLLSSAKILHLDAVSAFLDSVIGFLPNVAVAIFIILFAVRLGDFLGAIVGSTFALSDSHAGKVLSIATKNIVIAFGIMAGLVELHIAAELISIIFTGFIAMLALGGGLAFGLGGKDVVRELLEDLRKKK